MKIIKQSAKIVEGWNEMNLYERCEYAGRISHGTEDKAKEGSAEEFVRRMVKLGHESVFEFARIWMYIGRILSPVNLRTIRESLKQDQPSYFYVDACILANRYPAFFADLEHKVEPKDLKEHERDTKWIPVEIVTNRAISHQLVRYRKEVVYIQASQRYIKFHDDIEFIDPEVYFPDDGRPIEECEGKELNHVWVRSVWKDSMEGAEQDYIWCLSRGYSAQAARLFLPNSTATKLIMYASPDTWRHVFNQRCDSHADPMIQDLLCPLKKQFEERGLL